MSERHVMVDIEALGTTDDGLIVSVGAVKFDWKSLKIVETKMWHLDLDDQPGRVLNANTLKWWLSQPEEVQKQLTHPERSKSQEFIEEFDTFCNNTSKFWAMGVYFDFFHLENFYKTNNAKWGYSRTRYLDAKPIRFLLKKAGITVERQGAHHNALDDAVYQTQIIIEYEKYVRGPK